MTVEIVKNVLLEQFQSRVLFYRKAQLLPLIDICFDATQLYIHFCSYSEDKTR